MNNTDPSTINMQIGRRIRLRRNIKGYSQQKLGGKLGITFQQLQKYERGINRVSAARLYQLAAILNTSVSYFYENIESNTEALNDSADRTSEIDLCSKETMTLISNYYKISDPATHKALINLLKCLAETDTNDNEENQCLDLPAVIKNLSL